MGFVSVKNNLLFGLFRYLLQNYFKSKFRFVSGKINKIKVYELNLNTNYQCLHNVYKQLY